MRIFEVLDSGPVLAGSEELSFIVTMHGDEMELWQRGDTGWESKETRPMPAHNGLYGITVADAMLAADGWLNELAGKV